MHMHESRLVCSAAENTAWIVEVGYCAAARYHDKLLQKQQQQHERLTQIMQSKGFTVHVLPVLLGNIGEVFRSTLSTIKLAGANADRISKLASRLSTHAQMSMQSIIQSCRLAETTPQQSAQSHRRRFEPPLGGLSAHGHRDRYLPVEETAQSQVDSQAHAERRIIISYLPRLSHAAWRPQSKRATMSPGVSNAFGALQ